MNAQCLTGLTCVSKVCVRLDAAVDAPSDAVSTCDDAQVKCGSVCASLDTSAAHCGKCDHSCLGGTCVKATCQPATLATGVTTPFQLVVDDTNLYWTQETGSQVMKLPKAGGNPTPVASGQVNTFGITRDTDYLYWGSKGEKAIRRTLLAGGGIQTVTIEAPGVEGMRTDGSFVYFATDLGGLWRVAVGGGTPAGLTGGTSFSSVALDATNAYVGEYNKEMVVRSNLAGTAAASLTPTTQTGRVQGLAVDATFVYFATPLQINKVPIAGGSVTTFAASQGDPVSPLVDGTQLYWANRTSGAIMTAPLGGGAPVALATNQAKPIGLAVDATSIYWTNNGDGTVRRLAKP